MKLVRTPLFLTKMDQALKIILKLWIMIQLQRLKKIKKKGIASANANNTPEERIFRWWSMITRNHKINTSTIFKGQITASFINITNANAPPAYFKKLFINDIISQAVVNTNLHSSQGSISKETSVITTTNKNWKNSLPFVKSLWDASTAPFSLQDRNTV